MNVYEFRLRPQSAWGTPWHADTLWGSLCWAWLEAGGVEELQKLLARFRAQRPLFVVSDAMPYCLLPFPIGAKPAGYEEGKKMKTAWCHVRDFQRWSAEGMPELPAPAQYQRPFSTFSRLHSVQNRKTGAAADGGLFEEDEHSFNSKAFPAAAERLLSVFVRLLPEEGDLKQEANLLNALQTCFEMLGQKGYGHKASAGLGAFELAGKPERREWLEVKPGQNGFVSLSHFIPAKGDPRDGYWKLHVKNPKFASDLVPQPFKGNLITLAAGSTFRVNGELHSFYGRLIQMPRTGFDKALHYGLAFVAPILRQT